ncbi:MAG: 2-isopropylmalate synthase [Planctomycetota bacterium]
MSTPEPAATAASSSEAPSGSGEGEQRIRIFDTTLRDGEQSPGASLNHHEKLKIARQLQKLGVDVIEAGFPITSDGDFEAVSAIAEEMDGPIVCGLARCVDRDIDRAGEAVRRAKKNAAGRGGGRIHVFCATSKIHREHKLKKAFDQIIELSVRSVERARGFVEDVEFSPEDGSRTELDKLVEITQAVIEAGATTVNIPDTVGYAVPEEYGHIFAYVREKLPVIDERGIYLSSHCHNDLGLAVANSLSAVEQGARQIECTVNGIGERAGNAALEELVMAMRTRADVYGRYTTGINLKKIFPTSRMVSGLTGLRVQRNKAVVGENAFAHESGIHQDGMLKNRNTYEIMDPTAIGVPASKLVLGKHSGRAALSDRIRALGYTVDEAALGGVYDAFKTLADKKKDVYDEDIEALLDKTLNRERALWSLERYGVSSGSGAAPRAVVVMRDSGGETREAEAGGDGPLDAIFSAIDALTGVEVTLEDYQTRAVTEGGDAQGSATVRLNHHGRTVRGRGVSTDVLEAAAEAYVAAINRIKSAEARGEVGGGTGRVGP